MTGKGNKRTSKSAIMLLACAYSVLSIFATTQDPDMSDRVAMPLSRMIGVSDLIVTGDILDTKDSLFIFTIRDHLKGSSEKVIEVLNAPVDRFAETKPSPYRKGQSFVLFLEPKKVGAKLRWKSLGFREGQMPVENGFVYFQENNIAGLEFHDYVVNGVKSYVQRFDFNGFEHAVKEYGKCFKWSKLSATRATPEKTCTDSQLKKYSDKDILHRYLAEQTNMLLPK